jgi:hypothetical protein
MRGTSVRSLVLLLVAGCATTQPAPVPQRPGTDVAASFGRTWNALQVVIGEQGIPIRGMDRPSGIVVGADQDVPIENDGIADCGHALRARVQPVRARWDLLVRGDSTNAIVRAKVTFVSPTGRECESLGAWETALEQRVKAIAETRS